MLDNECRHCQRIPLTRIVSHANSRRECAIKRMCFNVYMAFLKDIGHARMHPPLLAPNPHCSFSSG